MINPDAILFLDCRLYFLESVVIAMNFDLNIVRINIQTYKSGVMYITKLLHKLVNDVLNINRRQKCATLVYIAKVALQRHKLRLKYHSSTQ